MCFFQVDIALIKLELWSLLYLDLATFLLLFNNLALSIFPLELVFLKQLLKKVVINAFFLELWVAFFDSDLFTSLKMVYISHAKFYLFLFGFFLVELLEPRMAFYYFYKICTLARSVSSKPKCWVFY